MEGSTNLEGCWSERLRVGACLTAGVGGAKAGRPTSAAGRKNSGLRDCKNSGLREPNFGWGHASRIWPSMWMLGGTGGRLTVQKFEKVDFEAIGSNFDFESDLEEKGPWPPCRTLPREGPPKAGSWAVAPSQSEFRLLRFINSNSANLTCGGNWC